MTKSFPCENGRHDRCPFRGCSCACHEGMTTTGSPRTWEAARDEFLEEIGELLTERHIKYGTGNIGMFGEMGIVVRIGDKLARLRRAIIDDVDGHDDTPNDDTAEDAWRDLAGYAIIALMWRHGYWELPGEAAE